MPRSSAEVICVHRIPHPTSLTIASAPPVEHGTGQACKDDLPDGHSEIFLRKGLDDPNQPERTREIGFYAHAAHASARADACAGNQIFEEPVTRLIQFSHTS